MSSHRAGLATAGARCGSPTGGGAALGARSSATRAADCRPDKCSIDNFPRKIVAFVDDTSKVVLARAYALSERVLRPTRGSRAVIVISFFAAFIAIAAALGNLPIFIETVSYYIVDSERCRSTLTEGYSDDCTKAFAFVQIYLTGVATTAVGLGVICYAYFRERRYQEKINLNYIIYSVFGILICLCGAFMVGVSLLSFL